jgi:serine/threonine protein phosphatase PrpC
LYGFADAPGFRADMEDAICAHSPLPDEPRLTGLFGVFDGHGGDFSSDFVSRHLAEYLVSSDAWKERDASPSLVRRALEDAFVKVDTALASQERMWVVEDPQSKDGRRYKWVLLSFAFFPFCIHAYIVITDGKHCSHCRAVDSSGSTGVVALVTESHVLVANAGDSRAILIHVMPSENGPPRIELEAMSQDHTAALTAERARIEAAGGIVDEQKYSEGDKECIGFRIRYDADVQGQSVAPSRGFGDFYYKQRRHLQAHEQVLTAFPEVRVTSRPPCDEEAYLLLACDGLWDVLTSKVNVIRYPVIAMRTDFLLLCRMLRSCW